MRDTSRRRGSSHIRGFYQLNIERQRAVLAEVTSPSQDARDTIDGCPLDIAAADAMSENVVSVHGLPLSIAVNFWVNQCDYFAPIVVVEPSVVAAACNASPLVRLWGVSSRARGPLGDDQARAVRPRRRPGRRHRASPAPAMSRCAPATRRSRVVPRKVARRGGWVDLDARVLDAASGVIVAQIYVDIGDAMGANLMDTGAEGIAPVLHALVGGALGLRISNRSLRRIARVCAQVNPEALGGEAIARGIVRARRFASAGPLRAVTHNKGVTNGIDAVAVPLGKDWRAIEAGVHAYAAFSGRYQPVAMWTETPDGVGGELAMSLAVGAPGGATSVHAGVRDALEIAGTTGARGLAAVRVCAGLACNLAALKALAGEGIQRGHMRLHHRWLGAARSVGEADLGR